MQYTKILLHFNPENPWKDEIESNIWAASNASITTANSRFGHGLNLNNASNSFLRLTTPIEFKDEDFTIDFWYKSNYRRIVGDIFSISPMGYTTNFINESNIPGLISCEHETTSSIRFYRIGCYPDRCLITDINTGILHHYAFVYDSAANLLNSYVDGILRCTNNFTIEPMSAYFWFGEDQKNGGWESNDAGVFDEFRYSTCKRWISNFTPPNTPYIMSNAWVQFPNIISGTYDSANGLKYYYRTKFVQGNYTTTSNVVNYEACKKSRYYTGY